MGGGGQKRALTFFNITMSRSSEGHFYIIFVHLEFSMLNVMFQNHQTFGSEKEAFLKVFIIYGHGSHLGYVTIAININLCPLIPRRLHIKFGFD